MCGIALLIARRTGEEAAASLRKMLAAIQHRGPDDEGTWVDETASVYLGHRRLSILDTSTRGRQPMVSMSGRYVIVYNGEIYNYEELREELSRAAPVPIEWRTRTDTEVLLAAIEHFGLPQSLHKLVGMFAFALWDRKEREISLVRDRMGKKPLYYGFVGGEFLAASELSAFRAVCHELRVDHQAMALLARFGFIPEPYAAYQGIKKLLPGTYLKLPFAELKQATTVREATPYFRLEEVIAAGSVSRQRTFREEEVLELVSEQLNQAVKQRLRSDVPFGAFLSGGIDSSLVVALMQQHLSTPVRTFSLGFEEADFDESEHAKKIAEHLGTQHERLIVQESDVFNLVPEMAQIYDEPFADSSQLPTTLVARLARKHVTVVLTGDGGDEVFAGYNRYVWGQRVWRLLKGMPMPLRKGLSRSLLAVNTGFWENAMSFLDPVMPARFRVVQAGEKMRKLARVARCVTPEQVHLDLATLWLPNERLMMQGEVPFVRAESPEASLNELSPLERALWFDTIQGLPGDMLVKVDRATMSVGLEARQPLLDHRLLEASWQIPDAYKIRDGVGKWPLRQLLAQFVPRELWERPKAGFSVPIDAWLRGPLREWSEDLLAHQKLDSHGVFRPEPVRAAFQAHLSGRANHGARLWAVLSAQAWLDETRRPSVG